MPDYDPETGRFNVPPYLGKESKELLERINQKTEYADMGKKLIAFGIVITTVESGGLSAIHTGEAVDAMASLPRILRGSIKKEIDFFRISRDFNKLSKQEKDFWEGIRDSIENPEGLPPGTELPTPNDHTCTEVGGPARCTCEKVHPSHAPIGDSCWCSKGKHGAGVER